jgi:hypothetical protein
MLGPAAFLRAFPPHFPGAGRKIKKPGTICDMTHLRDRISKHIKRALIRFLVQRPCFNNAEYNRPSDVCQEAFSKFF